ncbi:MAG: class I SAM-dependent methyltransferase [Planctomycetes bacterium]|nr:class I SAM-dependent methyltransferase [Planctomycetota bacterium]
MANQNNEPDTFFDHFSREDKPTKMGMWLVKALSRRIFRYAEIASGTNILEIGPGRGVFADICLEKGIEYCAVEPNQQMAASLEKRGANVIRAMVPPLPEIDRTFDTVVMINVMEHMNSMQDALQISRQIREVLKPKGKFVICSPDYLNWRHNFFNCDFSHNYVTTRRRLKQLLVNAGFENIKSCYLSGPLTGFVCFLVTALVSHLPFGLLNGLFPGNKVFYKLYKIQLTFLRKVLILGEKPG